MAISKLPKEIQVLLVDDDDSFREILGSSLKRMGYQVYSAKNGREAFERIQSSSVDVVVSDIRMPDGDGVELLVRTKALRPDIPVVLLMSGFTDLTTEEAYSKGAEALLSKPFNFKIIHETISRLTTPLDERWSRIDDRVDVKLRAKLKFPSKPGEIEAQVLNLGRGGMFVSLDRVNFPNMTDTIEFILFFDGEDTPFTGSGVIRWVRTKNTPGFPTGFGLEFTYLDEPGRSRIIEYINSRKPKAYIPNQ